MQSEAKEVERQLKKENKKISELESRATLFRRMVKHNIPTRDVSSFVVKQSNLTSTTQAPCKKTIKAAMKAKLLDNVMEVREQIQPVTAKQIVIAWLSKPTEPYES